MVVLGGKRRFWYSLEEILHLTAAWRKPQRQRELEAIEQAERERVRKADSVQQSEGYRLAEAERKIRELEQRLGGARREQP